MKDGYAGQNTLKMLQWLTDANSLALFQLEFANAFLVLAAPLFDYGDRLFYLAGCLKEPQSYDHVRQIAQVHRRFGRRDEPVLGQDENSHDALMVKIGAQFVELIVEIFLAGHGVEITIEAVNHDKLATPLHGTANARGEFAGRNFRRIHLLDGNETALDVLL